MSLPTIGLPATGLDILIISPSPSFSTPLATALLDAKFDDKRTYTAASVLSSYADSSDSDDDDVEAAAKRHKANDVDTAAVLAEAHTLDHAMLRTRHVRLATQFPWKDAKSEASSSSIVVSGTAGATTALERHSSEITVDYIILCVSLHSRPSYDLAVSTLSDPRLPRHYLLHNRVCVVVCDFGTNTERHVVAPREIDEGVFKSKSVKIINSGYYKHELGDVGDGSKAALNLTEDENNLGRVAEAILVDAKAGVRGVGKK